MKARAGQSTNSIAVLPLEIESKGAKVTDLLTVKNDIAKEVSQQLRLKLSAADQEKLTLGATSNPEAYQAYLKGKYFTRSSRRKASTKVFSTSIAPSRPDPDYALRRAGAGG